MLHCSLWNFSAIPRMPPQYCWESWSRHILKFTRELLYLPQNTRPEMAYEAEILAKVTYGSATKKSFHRLNDLVYLKRDWKTLTLKFYNLDKSTLRIDVFVNSGYNSNPDHSSHLRLLVVLTDKLMEFMLFIGARQSVNVSLEACLKTRHMISAKAMTGYLLKHVLIKMRKNISVFLFTDST